MKKINRTLRRCCLSGLISLTLFAPVPAVYAASIETGYSPEGTALQLVLKTIDSAQQEIRLMGYSFTSPEVAGALVRAKRRGVDVKVVLDWKANTGKQNQASLAAKALHFRHRHPGDADFGQRFTHVILNSHCGNIPVKALCPLIAFDSRWQQ